MVNNYTNQNQNKNGNERVYEELVLANYPGMCPPRVRKSTDESTTSIIPRIGRVFGSVVAGLRAIGAYFRSWFSAEPRSSIVSTSTDISTIAPSLSTEEFQKPPVSPPTTPRSSMSTPPPSPVARGVDPASSLSGPRSSESVRFSFLSKHPPTGTLTTGRRRRSSANKVVRSSDAAANASRKYPKRRDARPVIIPEDFTSPDA